MSIFESFISQSLDDSMAEYISSEYYRQQCDEIEQYTKDLQADLNTDQMAKLSKLLDLITSCDGEFALQAFKRGIAEGIAFRDEVFLTKT